MAKVIFKANQPIQSLSGTLCGVTFEKRANGQTVAVVRRGKDTIIDECVNEIQRRQMRAHPKDLQRIANERDALRQRIKRLYNKIIEVPELSMSRNQIRTAILREYELNKGR